MPGTLSAPAFDDGVGLPTVIRFLQATRRSAAMRQPAGEPMAGTFDEPVADLDPGERGDNRDDDG
ncbi:MAG: hypothetical protein M3R63_14470, partial [Actinomycetota bacterium]|nr:hypothetical protein [Actinomycetota bacterium]